MTTSARRTVRPTARGARGAVAAALAVAGAAALTSCSGDDDAVDDDLTYVTAGPLATTNAASVLGSATDAASLSARLYPGVFLPGPGNRLLPNTDLVTATPAPDNADTVDYTIADSATYSDGSPLVCDDFQLSWIAAQRPDLFADTGGLMTRVQNVECAAGERTFRVDFEEGYGSRYRELFGPGEVLPAHTVAENAGVSDLADALEEASAGDEDDLTAVGDAWSHTFDLAETDPSTVPTYGPFRIESRDSDGSLLLSVNPEWAGDRPGLDRIRVRGGGDASGALDGTADVISGAASGGQPTDADLTAAGFSVDRSTGGLVDGLTLAGDGVFETPESRRAFAACVDRDAVAAAVEKSTGAAVDPAALRVAVPGTPAAEALADTAARNSARDTQLTADTLTGTTVRIGYVPDIPRYAAVVDALTASCSEAGVTVVGVPLDAAALSTPGVLGDEVDAVLETRSPYSRNEAVTASPVSPVSEIRTAEDTLAQDATTVPLTVAPRFTVTADTVSGVSDSGTESGLAWNMDRWSSTEHPVSGTADADDDTEENK